MNQAEKLKSPEMKDDESWRMNDEGMIDFNVESLSRLKIIRLQLKQSKIIFSTNVRYIESTYQHFTHCKCLMNY